MERYGLYSREAACEYLDITLNNLNYHLRKGNISYAPVAGEKGGRVFTKESLDEFKKFREAGYNERHRHRVSKQMGIEDGKVYFVPDLARVTGVTRAHIYNMIARKQIIPLENSSVYAFSEEEFKRVAQMFKKA